MDNIWIPLISVLAGGTIALVSSVVTSRIKSKAEHKRELMGWAIQAALDDFKADRAPHVDSNVRGLPMSSYTFFHYNFFDLLERGKATPDEIKKLNTKVDSMLDAVETGPWIRASNNTNSVGTEHPPKK